MAATSTYGITGNPNIDGVLSGVKWGVGTLTFSFPQDASFYGASYGSRENLNAFEAFAANQQAAVRTILQSISSLTNLDFVEITETASVHGELRYAESDSTGTAWAYYPSTSALGGDAWFNNTKNYYDNPVAGNYGYLTIMHETGHALGLKHPHEVSDVFDVAEAGVGGILLKEMAASTLMECLHQVAAGGQWLPDELVMAAVNSEGQRRNRWRELSALLTQREVQIVGLALDGLPNKEIAARLGISEGTTKLHLNSIYRKVGVSSRAGLSALVDGTR